MAEMQVACSARVKKREFYLGVGDDQLLHVPPPAEELPERLKRLCDFANGVGSMRRNMYRPSCGNSPRAMMEL